MAGRYGFFSTLRERCDFGIVAAWDLRVARRKTPQAT